MVYNGKDLIAIILREEVSGEHLVFKVQKANSTDIAEMMGEILPLGQIEKKEEEM